jgi:hypothetical protein
MTVVPDEIHEVDPGGQDQEPLPEAQEEVGDLGHLGFGLDLGDFAQGEGELFSVMAEEDPETAPAFLKSNHCAAPTPPQRRYQYVTRNLAAHGKRVTPRRRNPLSHKVPKRGLEPPRAWLAH